MATIRVEDDFPDGFQRLNESWTLFAESEKKADATKRGRFNFGEKTVIATCEEATIVSTENAVRFDARGRTSLPQRRERGTVFEGRLRLTNAEYAACCAATQRLLPPNGVITTFNGKALRPRPPSAVFDASLRTEVEDGDGNLIRAVRTGKVHVVPVAEGEVGTLYEMGIPIVETGDAYHVDVQQKVPLGMDRDSVHPAYLRTLRTYVLNAMHDLLVPEQARSVWVRDALGTRHVSEDAVRTVVEHRFGPKAVVYDPSDPEANKLAVVKGYTVVHGGQLSAEEWKNVRAAGALLPAGKVTPSPKPFSPDGAPVRVIPHEDWSTDERAMVALYRRLASALIDRNVPVVLVMEPKLGWLACYGPESPLYLNRARLGRRFFEGGPSETAISLLIHELGHHYSLDHLSREYHDALTALGARLALAVAKDPGLLLFSSAEG